MQFGWEQIWSGGLIAVGVYWIIKRNVAVGIEGRAPSFYVKGKGAVLLGIAAILVGSVVMFEVPKHLKIDKCLDSGGRYNYEKNSCEHSKSTNQEHK